MLCCVHWWTRNLDICLVFCNIDFALAALINNPTKGRSNSNLIQLKHKSVGLILRCKEAALEVQMLKCVSEFHLSSFNP